MAFSTRCKLWAIWRQDYNQLLFCLTFDLLYYYQIDAQMKSHGLLSDCDRLRCIVSAIHQLGAGSHAALIRGAFTRSGMEGGRITPDHLKIKVFDIGKPHRSDQLPRVTAELLAQLYANRHLIQNVGTLVNETKSCVEGFSFLFIYYLFFAYLDFCRIDPERQRCVAPAGGRDSACSSRRSSSGRPERVIYNIPSVAISERHDARLPCVDVEACFTASTS